MSKSARHNVFISYSHSDEYWKNRLVTHLGVLEYQGALDLWDDRRIGAGEDWRAQIEKAINSASVAVLLVSADFLTSRFILDDEIPRLLQRRDKEGMQIIPVIVRPCVWQSIGWLQQMQVTPKDGKPLSSGNKNKIEANLAAIASLIHKQLQSSAEAAPAEDLSLQPDQSYSSHLPSTGNNLIGREQELRLLDQALDNPQVKIVSVVGASGVGKTALMNDWLASLTKGPSPKIDRVFCWSFYNQGSFEHGASSDLFIQSALKWLGDDDPARGSPWNKGERLAQGFRARKSAMILVGVELLQFQTGPQRGMFRAPALHAFLRKMLASNTGLCVLCATLPALELATAAPGAVQYIDLAPLSPEFGAQLLRAKAVYGNNEEMERSSIEFGGHPLALTLLGSYLSDVRGGSIIARSQIPPIEKDATLSAHVKRVLISYRKWFGEGPELCVLRMVGLFDRPASSEAINALRTSRAIPGLTDSLEHLTSAGWNWVVAKLRRARLLYEPNPDHPDDLDAHPLVREYFRQDLIDTHPDSWREGNNRLFVYLSKTAKEFPDNIWEMQPLKMAIAHGCRAGRHSEALEELYLKRVCRGSEDFITEKLTAHGENLAILSNFFSPPWLQPVSTLSKNAKTYVLNQTTLSLQAVGRLVEAAQTVRSGLISSVASEDQKEAAIAAGNLSEIYLTIGNLVQALSYAQYSVDLADRSGDSQERMNKRATLAYTLQQSGHASNAQAVFNEVEQIQKASRRPRASARQESGLYNLNVLLANEQDEQIQEKQPKLTQTRKPSEATLDLAIEHLSLGHRYLLQAKQGKGNFAHAEAHLNQAISSLQKAGPHHHLPVALLIRADLYTMIGSLEQALSDIDEALSIATRGDMGLHLVDCHLAYARVYLAKGQPERAENSIILAKKLIERTGYHGRDESVVEIEKQIEQAGQKPK